MTTDQMTHDQALSNVRSLKALGYEIDSFYECQGGGWSITVADPVKSSVHGITHQTVTLKTQKEVAKFIVDRS
jgi:hypothetical protein